jgi:hypothetical protein
VKQFQRGVLALVALPGCPPAIPRLELRTTAWRSRPRGDEIPRSAARRLSPPASLTRDLTQRFNTTQPAPASMAHYDIAVNLVAL